MIELSNHWITKSCLLQQFVDDSRLEEDRQLWLAVKSSTLTSESRMHRAPDDQDDPAASCLLAVACLDPCR